MSSALTTSAVMEENNAGEILFRDEPSLAPLFGVERKTCNCVSHYQLIVSPKISLNQINEANRSEIFNGWERKIKSSCF